MSRRITFFAEINPLLIDHESAYYRTSIHPKKLSLWLLQNEKYTYLKKCFEHEKTEYTESFIGYVLFSLEMITCNFAKKLSPRDVKQSVKNKSLSDDIKKQLHEALYAFLSSAFLSEMPSGVRLAKLFSARPLPTSLPKLNLEDQAQDKSPPSQPGTATVSGSKMSFLQRLGNRAPTLAPLDLDALAAVPEQGSTDAPKTPDTPQAPLRGDSRFVFRMTTMVVPPDREADLSITTKQRPPSFSLE